MESSRSISGPGAAILLTVRGRFFTVNINGERKLELKWTQSWIANKVADMSLSFECGVAMLSVNSRLSAVWVVSNYDN